MSSNIKVQRICQQCSNEFTARTTVTKYCSNSCAKSAYKVRKRAEKILQSNKETTQKKTQSIYDLKAREFLTVKEVARLLNCSVRTAYYYIENGTIAAVNLGQRFTRVKRSEIDKLFETKAEPKEALTATQNLSDCYTINEVLIKYGISQTGLQNLIEREGIPKAKKGKHTYVPKTMIKKHLT